MRLALCLCLILTQGSIPARSAEVSPAPPGAEAQHQHLQKTFEETQPQEKLAAVSVSPAKTSAATNALVAPAVSKPAPPVNAGAQPDRRGSFWKSLHNIGNAFWKTLKVLIFGALSIISNIIEGIGNSIWALLHGRLGEALAAPIQTGLNAALNSVLLPFWSIVTLSDAWWQWVKPNDPRVDVTLMGSGPRLRTSVIGGFLVGVYSSLPMGDAVYKNVYTAGSPREAQEENQASSDSNFSAYTFSSAFMYFRLPANAANRKLSSHEFGHTIQIQKSFLLDTLIERAGSGTAARVEEEADQIGETHRSKFWRFPGKFDN